MMSTNADDGLKSVLIVAAHPDDEVLGCGGTIARYVDKGRTVHVVILAEGATSRTPSRDRDAAAEQLSVLAEAARLAASILGVTTLELLSFPDNRMDGVDRLDVVKAIEEIVAIHQPSTVITHFGGDVNVDHRVTHDAVIAACRPQPRHPVKELLFFEVPSSTEWRPPCGQATFTPNCFVDISTTLDRKLQALAAYESELRMFPHPRSLEGVRSLAHWRGATCGVVAAEAFVVGRLIC